MSLPLGLSLLEAVVALHLLVCLLVYVPSALASLLRRWRSARATVTTDELTVTVLKPMRGLDPRLEENLLTFAALDAPSAFEVLLLLDEATDAAVPLARSLEARFPERFRVLIGTTPGHANPKVASLLFGLKHARNALIWVTDSNVETSNEHLRSHLAAWKYAQRNGRKPTLVHAPLVAVGGSGLGAAFERLHLATFNNIAAETSLVVGLHVVVGKSLLFHRDDLKAVGGLEAFGAASGEDHLMGVAFHQAGVVQSADRATRQVLGEQVSLVDFWRRQARWAALRKHMMPGSFFGLEHFSYFGLLWLWLAFGLLPWPVVAAVFALKMLGDAAVLSSWAGRPALGDALLVPLKDVVVLVAWCSAFFMKRITWRGRQLAVNADGSYAAVNAETSSVSEPQ